MPPMRTPFDFETMDVFTVAVEAASRTRAIPFGRGKANLRDQAIRASESVVLNIAEGRVRGGPAGRNQYRIALGSAGEMVAVFYLLETPEGPAVQELYRRVGAMLRKLAGPD
jgi:four helix bundle protein